MDKSSSAAHLVEYDNEKLISGTKVGIRERREDRTGLNVVLAVVLALSLLLSCLEVAYVCKIITLQKQNNEPNSEKESFPNSTRDRTISSTTDSLKLLVSLVRNTICIYFLFQVLPHIINIENLIKIHEYNR